MNLKCGPVVLLYVLYTSTMIEVFGRTGLKTHGGKEVGQMPGRSQYVRHVLPALIVVVGVGSVPTLPQSESKLIASDGAPYDWFGCSVALSGDVALVGSHRDDDDGENSGSAYVFERTRGVWTEVAKLTAIDAALRDHFGCSVALSGGRALVGAYGDDDNGSYSGSAYIFEKIDDAWIQTAKLTASDGAARDYFGREVALSGDVALVAAHCHDDNGTDSGSAYIFEKQGDVWVQTAKLTGGDGAANDEFGYCVSIGADAAVVGVPYDNDNGVDSGSAYIFEKIDRGWIQTAKLTASDGVTDDYFGYSVAISVDTALIGAYGHDENGSKSGAAYVFEKTDGVWVETAKLTPGDGGAGDLFGRSVTLDADVALIGGDSDDDNGVDSGSAYIFEKIGAGWAQGVKLSASDGAAGDYLGCSVALWGHAALVGAICDDDNGTDSGSAYVFYPFHACPGDLDGDWDTDQADLGILLADWGCTGSGCPGDLDADGDTDQADLGILLADWGCGA
jgi:hypothetical protein